MPADQISLCRKKKKKGVTIDEGEYAWMVMTIHAATRESIRAVRLGRAGHML
jgi:hypothetical protein